MTQLVLVRHGQTDWNVEGRYQGQTDQPLNAAGRAQAEALARQLASRRFDAVYSSDLLRALETAQIIAARLRLPVQVDQRLREISLGDWEGQRVAEIAAQYQAAWTDRARNPLTARAPGGETVAEVAARLADAAADIAERHPDGPVLVVSHGVALATLICQARQRPLTEAYDLIPDNGRTEMIDWPPAR